MKTKAKKAAFSKAAKNNSAVSASFSKKSKAALEAADKKNIKSKPYPIVAIGASAGGLEAITQLLRNLPSGTGMAYVYIQHLDPTHESMLSTILSKATQMPVLEAEEKMFIQPDHVFVIPPNKDMEIIDGVLALNPRPVRPHLHMPVNRFFQSLAEKQKDGAIGIVLSGNASDGTVGLKAIKAAGGITFAQDTSAKFQSMPASAVAEGVVDMVLPPDKIAKELERISRHTDKIKSYHPYETETSEEKPAGVLIPILQLLRKSTGIDFKDYKINTVQRRITRRMLLLKLNTLEEYHRFLKGNTNEVQLLLNDMLINVTSFFRDPELSEYLKKSLLPKIIKEKSTSDVIRIWVPACSTGQEAYSLAMLLTEVLGNKTDLPVQIFASDISESAIAKARVGLYSRSEVAEISPARLQRFFIREDNSFRVVKSIRDKCVFALHNVFRDPPFSHLDLVSCCNLLIYLDTPLQKSALSLFHYALNTDGYLVLGKAETIGTATSLFSVFDKKLKVYQRKKDGHARAAFDRSFRLPGYDTRPTTRIYPENNRQNFAHDIEKTVNHLLLSRYIPACVVVNEDMDILQFRGSTGMFLEPSPGKASLNLIKMARNGLGFELRNAIHKVAKTGKPVQKTGIEMKNKNVSHFVSIEVVPLKTNGSQNFLVVFEEEKHLEVPVKDKNKNQRMKKLEQELHATREDMGAVIEEREAVNEELQSANEEVVSSNEELQSINEELETSKEEIESANEELQTINQELQVRNDQLAESLHFSDSVFATLREAILVLDERLYIVKANAAFYRLFKARMEETEHQLIYDLGNRQWDIPKLRELLEDIIPSNQQFNGYEVSHVFPTIGEKVMVLNARKVRQPTDNKQLILLAIEDITEHTIAQKILRESEQRFREMANNAPVMIWTSDAQGNRTFFNKTWLEYTGKKMEEELGMGWTTDINPVDRDEFLALYNKSLEKREPFTAEYRLVRHDSTYRWVLSSARPFFDINKKFTGFIGSVNEIHDQRMINKELEQKVNERTKELKEANLNLERSNEELRQFAFVASHDLQEPLRKILTFSDLLKKNSETISDKAKEQVDKIMQSSMRMKNMVEDLLDYSSGTATRKQFETVSLSDILKDVLKDFDTIIIDSNAQINWNGLPKIEAVPVQMKQLFHNLISNSLKFKSVNMPPVVHIESRIVPAEEVTRYPRLKDGYEYCEIIFKDNGIGFKKEYAEQIFVIFQRLHEKDQYEGTGIGLALCKKIVRNHGGEILAESEDGKGATFRIILPVAH